MDNIVTFTNLSSSPEVQPPGNKPPCVVSQKAIQYKRTIPQHPVITSTSLNSMSLKQKIAYNTLIQLIAKIVAVIFGTITIAIMTRYLGQEGFGEYSTIVAFLAFFGILADFGLQITTVNLMSNPKYDADSVFRNAFTLRALSAGLLFIIAPVTILLFPYSESIKIGAFILTLNYALLALHQLLLGLFQRHLQMGKVAVAEITGKVLLLLGIWIAATLDLGLYGMLWVIVASTLVQVALSLYATRSLLSFSWEFNFSLWKKIITDSWPIALSIVFNLIYFKADTVILSLTQSQSDVGLYSAPYRMLEILTAYPYLFVGLLFPLIAQAWQEDSKEKFNRYFQITFDLLVIAAIPLLVGTFPLADRIMTLIAGEQFQDSGIILQFLIVATALIFVNVIFGYTIVTIGKQKQMIWAYATTAAFALTLYWIYIPIYSYMAAALITILAEFFIFCCNYYVATKTINHHPSLKIILQSLIASLVMFGGIILLYQAPLLLIIAVSMVVYTLTLYLVGGISKQMVLAVFQKNQSHS